MSAVRSQNINRTSSGFSAQDLHSDPGHSKLVLDDQRRSVCFRVATRVLVMQTAIKGPAATRTVVWVFKRRWKGQ
jgi:hypothetical protein